MMHGVLFHGVWSCASDVYCGGRCLRREGREGKGKAKGKGKVVSPDGIGMGFVVPRGGHESRWLDWEASHLFVWVALQKMRTRRIYHTQIVLVFFLLYAWILVSGRA
jgi:hypothetical protein